MIQVNRIYLIFNRLVTKKFLVDTSEMNIKGRGSRRKEKPLNYWNSRTYKLLFTISVELEGIEPSSKRGNHKLSTCLSLPKFSCSGRTKAINRCLIL